MPQLYSNNARSTLVGAILSTATSLEVSTLDATKFPAPVSGDFFDLTLQDATNIEIVRITARVGGVMTIGTRALEGTTANAFALGTVAGLRLTAAVTATAMNHIPLAVGAHAASAISNAPSGNIAATTVQAAINELDAEKLSNVAGAVLTANLADLNVTTGKLADLGVTTGKLADLNVTTGKLADASVTAGKIADATLVALAGLDAVVGVVEQTGVDVFTKRAIGAATTSIPRVSDILGSCTVGVPSVSMRPRLTDGAVTGTVALATNGTLVVSHNYDPGIEQFAQFTIPAPKSFNSAIALTGIFEWSHPATTVNFGVAWAVRAKYVGDNIPLDGAWSAFVQVVDTGGVTDNLYVSSVTAGITPAGVYAENCAIMFEIKRTIADAADTMAVVARLQRFAFKYSTLALNDA